MSQEHFRAPTIVYVACVMVLPAAGVRTPLRVMSNLVLNDEWEFVFRAHFVLNLESRFSPFRVTFVFNAYTLYIFPTDKRISLSERRLFRQFAD